MSLLPRIDILRNVAGTRSSNNGGKQGAFQLIIAHELNG
jgi:hypothetical protein